jgi:hypothetical protein
LPLSQGRARRQSLQTGLATSFDGTKEIGPWLQQGCKFSFFRQRFSGCHPPEGVNEMKAGNDCFDLKKVGGGGSELE